jgi:hypothetical protein
MPFINLLILFVLKFSVRFLDSNITMFKNIPETKKKTIQAFVNLYAGPEISIHFRYSAILNQIWVAMTHGLAIPMLFPISLFGIFNMYVVEKMLFAWFYKQPPLFDNKLNERALDIVKMSPIVFLGTAYWQLGNRQMFFNEVSIISRKNETMNPNHFLFDFTNGFNSSLMILVFFICFNFTTIIDTANLRVV